MNAVRLEAAYAPSEDTVAREIEGELVIVPLATGMGDMEDDLFTLNDTGRAIWDKLDGKRTVADIVADLAALFDAPATAIQTDVIEFMQEVLKRGMIVESKG